MALFSFLHFSNINMTASGHVLDDHLPKLNDSIQLTLEHLKKENPAGRAHVDAIILTGGLTANSTTEPKEKQFEKLKQKLDSIIKNIGSRRPPLVLAVPGHSDIQPIGQDNIPAKSMSLMYTTDISKEMKEMVNSQLWENPHDESTQRNNYHKAIYSAFAAYEAWWRPHEEVLMRRAEDEHGFTFNRGMFPGDYTVTLQLGMNKSYKLGILALNLSYSQLLKLDVAEPRVEGRQLTSAKQIEAACGGKPAAHWAQEHDTCIFLSHNRLESLEAGRCQNVLKEEVYAVPKIRVHMRGQNTPRDHYKPGPKDKEHGIETWAAPSLFGDGPVPGYAAGVASFEHQTFSARRAFRVDPKFDHKGKFTGFEYPPSTDEDAHRPPRVRHIMYVGWSPVGGSLTHVHQERFAFDQLKEYAIYGEGNGFHLSNVASRLRSYVFEIPSSAVGKIVHFSGHMEPTGMEGIDERVEKSFITTAGLRAILDEVGCKINLVFLNGCNSAEPARELSRRKDSPIAIGTTAKIYPNVAVAFALQFYMQLEVGKSTKMNIHAIAEAYTSAFNSTAKISGLARANAYVLFHEGREWKASR